LIDLIKKIWLRNPSLRFNQLLYNLQHDYSQKNDGVGQVKEKVDGLEHIGFDFFNVEDSFFIEYLHSIVTKRGR